MDHPDALTKLPVEQPCTIVYNEENNAVCPLLAQWAINGMPICLCHIGMMADMNSDNEEFLAPALLSMSVISSPVV